LSFRGLRVRLYLRLGEVLIDQKLLPYICLCNCYLKSARMERYFAHFYQLKFPITI
jgi:hypothetical protein